MSPLDQLFHDIANSIPEWVTQAACGSIDPELWFPTQGQPHDPATRICHTCPVQTECANWAITNNEHHGIWGGATHTRHGRQPEKGAA